MSHRCTSRRAHFSSERRKRKETKEYTVEPLMYEYGDFLSVIFYWPIFWSTFYGILISFLREIKKLFIVLIFFVDRDMLFTLSHFFWDVSLFQINEIENGDPSSTLPCSACPNGFTHLKHQGLQEYCRSHVRWLLTSDDVVTLCFQFWFSTQAQED